MSGGRAWALSALFLLGALYGRMLWVSRAEWNAGAREEEAGRFEEAVYRYDRAVRSYAPLNPYGVKAVESLWSLSIAVEAKNPSTALLALDALRGGANAVRHVWRPHDKWLPKVNERIASLRADEEAASGTARDRAEALAYHRKVLTIDERPPLRFVLLVQAGFLGWIGCTIGLIVRGFDRDGRMHLRPSLPWIAGVVSFFALWLLGLKSA